MPISLPAFRNQPVAVLGLAKTGLSAAKALQASGATVLAWDDGEAARAEAAAAGIAITDLTAADWRAIRSLVISPGIPHTHPKPHPVAALAKSAGAALICDIELLARAVPQARLIGITGTNGKSTTTALTGHVLRAGGLEAEVGGNIGTPVLDLPAVSKSGSYVLELSSYQLELIPSLTFDTAVLLNITPDHLGRHGGMDGYIAAKRRIFRGQIRTQAAIIGVDEPVSAGICAELQAAGAARVIPVKATGPVAGGVFVDGGTLFDGIDGAPQPVIAMAELPRLAGTHNAQNACASYAVARVSGLAPAAIAAGLRSFPGLAHRQELVTDIGGVRFVNDSKATNADATARALDTYRDVYWIAGGQAKEGGIGSLGDYFPRIRHAFLIGEAEAAFADTLAGRVPVSRCGTLDRAVTQAAALAAADVAAGKTPGVVLLSPACASWDQFRNFEHRGEVFATLARALPGA